MRVQLKNAAGEELARFQTAEEPGVVVCDEVPYVRTGASTDRGLAVAVFIETTAKILPPLKKLSKAQASLDAENEADEVAIHNRETYPSIDKD